MIRLLRLGALALLAAAPAQSALPGPVRTEAGLVRGVPGRSPGVTAFKGIPYAAPPIGARRWRPPTAPAGWNGVLEADRFGDSCPQPGPANTAMSEDCLKLNIWTGASSPRERRPVMVWIHVFMTGSGSSPEYDGEALAKKGIVVVTINFRIGPFGYLALRELTREAGTSGNFGVLDQIAALRWVRANIARFGGDPTRVTIASTSAQRGSSAAHLAVAPAAAGLFRGVISESQFPIPNVLDIKSALPPTLAEAERQGQALATRLQVTTLAQLRALPWRDIVAAADDSAFQPIVDGKVIPIFYAIADRPASRGITFVAGNNRNEGGAPVEASFARLRREGSRPGRVQPNLTLAAYLDWAKARFGGDGDAFLRLYPASNDDEAALQNNAAVRDYTRVSTWVMAARWSKDSGSSGYTYFWTHPAPGSGSEGNGAGHGGEVAYVFDSLDVVDRPWTETDRRIAATMSSYWANMVSSGNPNGSALPAWKPVDPAAPRAMELGDHFAEIPLADPAKRQFWEGFIARMAKR